MSVDYLAGNITPLDEISGQFVNSPVGNVYFLGTSSPLIVNSGNYWYNPTTNILSVQINWAWVDTGVVVEQANTEPTAVNGAYWYDLDGNTLSVYDGVAWVVLVGGVVVSSSAMKLNYSQLTSITFSPLRIVYSQVVVAISEFKALYDIINLPLIPVTFETVFRYAVSDGKVIYTEWFPYAIENNRLRWSLTKISEFGYSLGNPIPVTNTVKLNYADLSVVNNLLKVNYADAEPIVSYLAMLYADTIKASTTLVSSYGNNSPIILGANFWWLHIIPVSLSGTFGYEISNKQYVELNCNFGYSIQNQNIQSIEATPTLYKDGGKIDFIVINLSMDESSPYWIGGVSIARIEDFSKIAVEDTLVIQFNDQTFNMIVDGKNLSRGDNAAQSCHLSMISPTALYDSPFSSSISKSYATATSAKVVVEDMLGVVAWNLPDWLVPVGQLQFTNTTPMQVARSIVSAIGGLVETTPEGNIICRKTFNVNVPDYNTANAYSLADTDLFSIKETIAPQKIINRVDLYTQELGAIQDALEYKSDEGTNTSGVIYGYPSPTRPVNLVHTGAPSVVINPVGVNTRIETETVEFKSGKAQTQYPIESISAITWHYTNLGAVSFNGKNLSSAIEGESLLILSYQVKAYKFNVAGQDTTQFLLSDA